MRLVLLAVLPAVLLADLKIDLEYSVDNFANVFDLGKVDLRRQFDGNFTAVFTPRADDKLAGRLRGNPSGLYRVRTKGAPGGELSSFTEPCLLLKSKLFHYFSITVDSDRQLLHSFTVFPDVLAAGGQIDSQCNVEEFASLNDPPRGTVHVSNKGILPNPDTQSFVTKMERERKARQQGGGEADNRSFLAKYWMYIVPVVIFVLISNAVTPEGQGQAE